MRHAAAAVLLLFLTATASAATFNLPTDAELLGRADLVVVATVLDSASREASDRMILTDHRLRVEQVLKGTASGTIVISEVGGFVNGRGMEISGSARYERGTRVLTFLRKRDDGTYYTAFMALGQYRFERNNSVLVRDARGIESPSGEAADARDARTFVQSILTGDFKRGPRVATTGASMRLKPATNAAASAYVFSDVGNTPKRWEGCEAGCTIGFTINNVQPVVDTVAGLNAAFAAWTNHPNSFVSFDEVGLGTQSNQDNDDVNDIVFNWDGTNPHSSCEGALGCGIIYFSGPPFDHVFRGETFWDVISADVVIRSTVTNQNTFNAVLTHELGHALAFRHSNQGTPSGTGIMNSSVPTANGAQLGPWDEEALTAVYGPGVACVPVTTVTPSGGGTVDFGSPRQLSVTANGDTPRTYQWYEGNSGVTTTPVGTNSSTFTTPPITTARSYWVRVSNSCTVGVNSATITVTPAACTPPEITSEPTSRRINPNTSTTLTVTANGSQPFYQWYRSATVGDTTNLVGSNSASFTTPSLQTTTSYWVRVSNNCGQDDSALATVTVSSTCVPPSITGNSPSTTITTGQSTTLSVTAAGDAPFTYQWYTGESPNQSTPVPNATGPALPQGPFNIAGAYKYWVRVQNACGHVESATITITVSPNCVPPTISSASTAVNVILGEGATISVLPAGGTPFTFQWYEGASGDPAKPIAGANNASLAVGPFTSSGAFGYWVLITNPCGQVGSATITITVGCPPIVLPLASSPAITNAASGYEVSWTGDLAVTPSFELQEATNADFTANLRTFSVPNALSRAIPAHNEITVDKRFYYRVRAISGCTGQPSGYSLTATTVVTTPPPANSAQFAISVPEGTTQTFVQDYLVPGFGESATSNDTFSITVDVPWITVFPASGALSAGGTTVQFTISPGGLGVGSKTATILVQRTNGPAAGKVTTNGGSSSSYVPFGLSLVTPVSPDPRDGNPPPGTLIIPAVAHAQGIGSPFRSDVRIVNVSFDSIDYEISYTPSQTDGTEQGKKTNVTIAAGDTLAFDDIVSSWYGAGMLGEGGVGTIEIRPLNSLNPLDTFASSRTYAIDGGGTLGQFIPALRLNSFVGNIAQDSLGRISLQQVANSSAYRTNVGFVEGSGKPVSLLAKLLDGNNNVLAQTTRELSAFGHFQTSMTALFGDIPLEDGRVEVEATSTEGKVSAYASVLNNNTNDPLMVFPVQPARTTAERYVLAGMAEFVASDRNFHSHMRIYNGGNTAVTATLNYYERGQSTPLAGTTPVQITLNPGQVRAINDVLPTLWNLNLNGGSVVATAPAGSSLVLTAQTFSRELDGGTKGQFIPGVTQADAVGFGERGLEVLQLEQSPQYRSNVGFVEVTGHPATIEVTAVEPDTKVSVVTSIPLGANEYRQFDRILEQMGLGTVYNGRVNVKVITGEGRVFAYGSTIDNRTEDPTYVPGQ
ncbi:MAG: hypothetical protein ABI779_05685 [Acidobacteriota bacterium]